MTNKPKNVKTDSAQSAPLLIVRLFRDRGGAIGLFLVLSFACLSLLGLFEITPYPVLEQHPIDRLQAPSSDYWFGTDQFGRDIFSRVMKGGADSLQVAFISVFISSFLGTVIGILAGYTGGLLDTILMRLMDMLFAFP